MLRQPGPFQRSLHGSLALPGLAIRQSRRWFDDPALADLALVADFGNDRYAVPNLAPEAIATAGVAELCRKRSASFAEVFAFSCTSDVTRSYVDAGGMPRNDLAIDQPRFDWANGRRQLALNAASTNLVRDSAVPAAQTIAVTAQSHTLSFTGSGSVTVSGAASATLSGTGTAARVFASFTASAGGLTLTPSGDVRLAQLEPGLVPTAWIPTGATAAGRTVETAQFAAIPAALLQRTTLTAIVRGQGLMRGSGRILGLSAGSSLLQTLSARLAVNMGGSSLLTSGTGTFLGSASWAAGAAFDGSGRSVVRDGSAAVTDAGTPIAARGTAYLARDGAGTNYGDGFYDWVGLAPTRLSTARLAELAVPAG